MSGTASCNWGWLQLVNGECKFLCERNHYINKTEVTFDQLESSCYSIRSAAEQSLCSSLDDLVFPEHSDGCGCPYCKCDSSQKDTSTVMAPPVPASPPRLDQVGPHLARLLLLLLLLRPGMLLAAHV